MSPSDDVTLQGAMQVAIQYGFRTQRCGSSCGMDLCLYIGMLLIQWAVPEESRVFKEIFSLTQDTCSLSCCTGSSGVCRTYPTVRLETPPLHLTLHSLHVPTCQMDPEQEAAVHVLDSWEPASHSNKNEST